LTQMLTGWSTRGGAAEFLARRLALKRASLMKVRALALEDERLVRCVSDFCTVSNQLLLDRSDLSDRCW
jgi:hypothetical protein